MAEAGIDAAACAARARAGDDDAARALVAHLWPLVARIVQAHRPRRMAVEDLMQEVFMKVFARLEQFRGAVPLEHWVSRIAVTTCLDALRAQRSRPELRMSDLTQPEADALEACARAGDTPHPSMALGARELLGRLAGVLSPEDQLVFDLLHVEERPVAEIQRITGWSRAAIKVRAFRARLKLRKVLEKLERKP